MLLINLIFEFCVVIVQAGCTPRAWLLSDLATSPLVCNLYIFNAQKYVPLFVSLAPDDYATTQVGLTFTGQPITVNIPIVSDAIEDPDETFIVRLILEEESDGILIIPDVTTVTIIDGSYLTLLASAPVEIPQLV